MERARLSSKTLLIIAGALLVGYSLALIPGLAQSTAPTNNGARSQIVKFDIPSYAPYRGANSTAQINVVEFGDYQCPFCDRFFLETEPQVLQNYVNTGKVRFYYLDFAILGADSLTLAQGSWCANEQGKFFGYHDYVFSHQGQENTGWATASKVKSFVGNISGLDTQKFGSCLDSNGYGQRVDQLKQLGQSTGATGTPTIFVGNNAIGYIAIVGAQPYSVYQQVMDSQIQLAKSSK